MNTRRLTKAEMVAVDDVMGQILWTKNFLESQGYPVKENILYQDNRSAMVLESNEQKSVGKRSHHINICYFFVTRWRKNGNIQIEYFPRDKMLGDYMSKPTHGKKFHFFQGNIINMPLAAQLMMMACCEGLENLE